MISKYSQNTYRMKKRQPESVSKLSKVRSEGKGKKE